MSIQLIFSILLQIHISMAANLFLQHADTKLGACYSDISERSCWC